MASNKLHRPQRKFLDIMFNIVEVGSKQIKNTANSSPAEHIILPSIPFCNLKNAVYVKFQLCSSLIIKHLLKSLTKPIFLRWTVSITDKIEEK